MKRRGAYFLFRVLLAACTVMCAGLLAWHCLDIFLAKRIPGSFFPIFTWEDVSARLGRLAPWLLGYAVLAVIGLVWQAARDPGEAPSYQGPMAPLPSLKKRTLLRAGISAAALLLLLLGIVNGGLQDVLIKAINICTECIGLG